MEVAIIGGGASGIFCACVGKSCNITIYESAEKYGKKILATGNGRCNLTNVNMNECSYNADMSKHLERFSSKDCLAFFKSLGLETYTDEEGRVYPISNTATSVVSVLKNYLDKKNNIKIETNLKITDIFFENNKYKLIFEDKSFKFYDKVVVSSGNYTNLKVFDKFNIKYKNFVPSLCSLKTDKHKSLSGIRVDNVRVICEDNHISFNEFGEILYKDEGISGIVIFNLSSQMARINNFNHDIFIDFLPNISLIKLTDDLKQRKVILKNYLVEEFLTGMFHKQINLEILKRAKIELTKSVNELFDEEIEKIAYLIKNYKLTTCGYYENNQVMSGGICLDELDDNLQSKKYKGLYFTGEVIDVDGVCGGYNLQWAWTSGFIVGESL